MQDKDMRNWMIKRRKKNHRKATELEVIYTGMFQMMAFENEENISFLNELNDEILQRSSDEESGLGFLLDVTVVRYFVISFFKQKKKKKRIEICVI